MVNSTGSAWDRYQSLTQEEDQKRAATEAAQHKLGLIDRAINLQRQHPELDTPEKRAFILSERQKMLKATRKQGEVGIGEWFKTQYDVRQTIPFIPTGETTQLIFSVLPVVRKVKNNKPLTLDEELLLQDYYNEIETEGERGRTMLAMAADIVATMPAYMGEFAAGKALVGTAAKKATETAIKKIVKSYAKKGFGKYAVKAAGTLASGAAMAGTVGAMGAVESGARHYTTTESGFTRSAYQGFVDQWAEMTGEQVGGAMSNVFGKVTKKIIPPTSALGKNLAKISNSELGKRAEQWAQKVGYNGTIEEMGEERFSDMMRAVLGVGEWSDVIPDKKQFGAEAIGFAVPGVARTAIGAIGARGKTDIEGQPIKQPRIKSRDDGGIEVQADTVEEAQQYAQAIDEAVTETGENAKIIQEGTKVVVKPVKPEEAQIPTPTEQIVSPDQLSKNLQDLPVKDIKLSKDVPQFKEGADPETGVVAGEQLQGEYRDDIAKPIAVWERENGDLEVITGRHRLDLARRSGRQTILSQVFREEDGYTAEDLLTLDAEDNILDEKGSVKDYARYFRNKPRTKEQADRSGLTSRDKGRKGFSIGTYATDTLYNAFLQGAIGEQKAAAISAAAPNNEDVQSVAISKAKTLSADELVEFAKILQRTTPSDQARKKAKQGNLFAYDDSAIIEAEKISKEIAKEIQSVKDKILSVKGNLKRPETAKSMGVGLEKEEQIRETVKELENYLEDLSRAYTNPTLMAMFRERAGLESAKKEEAEKEAAPVTKIPAKKSDPQLGTGDKKDTGKDLFGKRVIKPIKGKQRELGLDTTPVAQREVPVKKELVKAVGDLRYKGKEKDAKVIVAELAGKKELFNDTNDMLTEVKTALLRVEKGGNLFEQEQETAKPQPQTPHETIANEAAKMIADNKPMNNKTVVELGKTHLGSIAGKTREVYDSIEAGLNLYIRNSNVVDFDNPENTVEQLLGITDKLPRQNTRNEQQVELQQFSTPPAEAFVATYAADIQKGEKAIEPSAGTGNLATMAQIAGASVDTNEIDTLRGKLLKILGFNVTNYDAEQLDNLLPENKMYDVVVMNPPFSATGGRVKGHNTKFGARHVEQALNRLKPGGRLVAIVGNGMAFGRPNFEGWWNNIRSKYNVLANVGIDGNFYGKYGTTFDNNIIVIEKPLTKEGLTNKQLQDIIQGEKLSPMQAIERLKPLRNRKIQNDTQTNQSESKSRNAETGSERQLPSVQRGDTPTDMGGRGRSDSGRAGGVQTGVDRERPSTGRDGGMAGDSTVAQAGSATEHTEGVSARPGIKQQQTGVSDSGRSVSGARSRTSNEQSTKPGLDRRVEAKEQYSADDTASETETSGFVSYKVRKAKIKDSNPHPTALVETAAASSVELPAPKISLQLPKEVIKEGRLSDAQLEAVVMATQSFETELPDGSAQGFWIGDGTGVGKGREIFGCIYEQLQRGKKRAVHISIASQLAEDSKRDMDAVGVPMDFIKQSDFNVNSDISDKDGVLFTTYSLASTDYKKSKARFNQMVKWLGEDFDGVIALDEVHKAKNAAADTFGKTSTNKGTDTGAMVLALQNAFPKAKILYVTATGASEVRHLAPFKRLGLWGKGAPFPDFVSFSQKMNDSGVAAMEMLQRDLKATGKFMARTISYEGVVNNPLQHTMTEAEKRHYDKLAGVWQSLLVAFDEAAEKANDKSKGWSSQFYNTQQRFFLQLMMGYEMGDLIASIENDLKANHSVVISLLNTGETYLKDAKTAQINNQSEQLDLSYRQMLVNLIQTQFPIAQYEEYTDPDTGTTKTRQTEVINRENQRKQKELIDQVSEIELPNNALDVLTEHFGVNNVAEITGRSIRVEDGKIKNRKIPGVKKSDLNAHETEQFQEGKKRIAIISGAASTGISLHSDKGKANQQKRVLYAFQLSWSADVQMQIFGRVHRSFQANAPEIRIVTLDLAGQQRLVSAISRRLASLGALTKGDRSSLSGDMFQSEDITDEYGKAALRALYSQLDRDTLKAMNLLNNEGKVYRTKEDDVSTFLNRIMVLPVDLQNKVFNQFYTYYQQNIEAAKQKELFDFGVEEIKASNIRNKSSVVINTDEASGAQTVLNTIAGEVKVDKMSFAQADKNAQGFYQNKISKEVYAAVRHEEPISNKPYYRLHNVTSARRVEYIELGEKFTEVSRSEARIMWDKKYSETADTKEREYHILSGAVFPIYNQLFSGTEKHIKVKRANLANGKQIIGLHLTPKQAAVMQARVAQSESLSSMTTEALMGLMEAGSTIGVANGWFLEKSTIRGEEIIEIVRTETKDAPQGFQEYGFIDEMINYRKRWFIPVENAEEALTKLFNTYKPISKTEVTDSNTGGKKIKAFGGSLGSPAARVEAIDNAPVEFQLTENQARLMQSVANLDTTSQRLARLAMTAISKMPQGVSRMDIVGFMRKAFGIPIKGYGTKRSSVNFAEYDTKGRIIRAKNARDIGNIAHEVGHAIDWGVLNRWSKNPPSQEIAQELTELGEELYEGLPAPKGGYKSEGFAEFIALYIDNALDGRMFATQEWFRNTFSAEHPTLYDNIRTARMLWNTYKKQGAERRIKAFMGEQKVASQNSILNKGILGSIVEWYRRTIDDGYPIKKLVDFYYSQGGELLADKDNPFLLYSLRRGTVNGTVESFLFSNTTDITGINDTGMSLSDAYSIALKGESSQAETDFDEFLILLRAAELEARGIKSGINYKDIAARIETLTQQYGDKFHKAAKEVHAWNDRLLEYAVEAGLFTREQKNQIVKDNTAYVPFHRVFEQDELARRSGGTGKGLSAVSPVKRIKGSDRGVQNIRKTMAQNAHRIITAAHKAEVSNALAKLANQSGMAEWIEKMPAPMEAVKLNPSQISKKVGAVLEENGIDEQSVIADILKSQDFNNDMWTAFQPAMIYKGNDYIVPLRIDGKQQWFRVHKELYEPINGIEGYRLPPAADKLFGIPTRMLRLFATGLNLPFAITNFIHDAGFFLGSTKNTPNPLRLFRGVASDLKGDAMARAYKALGLELSGYIGQDKAAFDVAERIVKKARGKTFIYYAGGIANPLHMGRVIGLIRKAIGITESGVRIAEFEASYKKYLKENGGDKYSAAVRAGVDAKDVTVDFTRGSRGLRFANQLIAFTNARLQGYDKLWRLFKEKPVQTTARYALIYSLPALLLWWKYKDDEWFSNMSDWEKTNYLHLQISDDVVLRIPRNREQGQLFGGLAVAIIDSLYKQDPESVKRYVKTMAEENDWHDITPTAVLPLIEAFIANENFMNVPIEPDWMKSRLPQDRYFEHTTEIAKNISKALSAMNITASPLQIEHLLNGYFAGAYRSLSRLPEIERGRDLPIASKFTMREPSRPTQQMNDFYDRKDELQQRKGSGKATAAEQRVLKAFNKITSRVQKYNKQIRDEKDAAKRRELYGKMRKLLEQAKEIDIRTTKSAKQT